MKSILLFLVILCLVLNVSAQNPGDFDLSFATLGYRTDPTPDTVEGFMGDIMADGRIVTVGVSDFFPSRQLRVFRYLPDGSLDSTLAQTGTVLTNGPHVNSDDPCAALQSDGKILVAYRTTGANGNSHVIGRLKVNGTLDNSFGNGGWVIDSVTEPNGVSTNILVQQDGKIIVTGTYQNDSTYVHGFYAMRLLQNGTVDASYGVNGVGTLEVSEEYMYPTTARLQADGKLLLLGTQNDTITSLDNDLVARLNSDGSIDSSFGTNGLLGIAVFTYEDNVRDIAVGPSGEIYLVGGDPFPVTWYGMKLGKYTSNGILDTTFGTGGYLIFDSGHSDAYPDAMELQPDGKIVIAGTSEIPGVETGVFMVARVLPTGALDTGFGTNGIADPLMTLKYNAGYDLALQADGKIVVTGGGQDNFREEYMTVARYLAGPTTAVTGSLSSGMAAEIFPNPSVGGVALRLDITTTDEVSVSVMDMLGREVLRPMQNAQLDEGVHTLPLDVTGLGAGTYLVRVIAEDRIQSLRMVIQ